MGRSVELRGGAAWGCAGAWQGAVQGRGAGPRRGAAAWGCAGAQCVAAQGRSSVGLRRESVVWGREGAQQRGAA